MPPNKILIFVTTSSNKKREDATYVVCLHFFQRYSPEKYVRPPRLNSRLFTWWRLICILYGYMRRFDLTINQTISSQMAILFTRYLLQYGDTFIIARSMGPAWGPLRSCRPQVGPMWVPWTLLYGLICVLNLASLVIWSELEQVDMVDSGNKRHWQWILSDSDITSCSEIFRTKVLLAFDVNGHLCHEAVQAVS